MDPSIWRTKKSDESHSTRFQTSRKRKRKFTVKPETANTTVKDFSRQESGRTHSLESARKKLQDVEKTHFDVTAWFKEQAASEPTDVDSLRAREQTDQPAGRTRSLKRHSELNAPSDDVAELQELDMVFSRFRQQTNQPNDEQESGGTHSLVSARKKYHDVRKRNFESRKNAAKKREEIKIALQKYNQRKQQKNRKLMAKTSKGQPLMKNRIEILLEKIRSPVVQK